jgi:hypothetical protein
VTAQLGIQSQGTGQVGEASYGKGVTMKITRGHVLMPILCIVLGVVLIILGTSAGWGLVWAMGGGFFVVFGVGALVLVLAWVLPGRSGGFLRRPIVSILIVGAILIMMSLTVWVGLASRGW